MALTNMINNIKFLLLVFPLFFLWSCASLPHKANILAVVDDMPITEADLAYALQVAHRREDLSSAQELNIRQYVQKLIDDALIIQEAVRMDMEQYPEVQKAEEAYLLRESVMRLHDEEIVRKVSVTEEEIKNYYKENFEQYSLGIIESGSEEEAAGIMELLKKGEDFSELARQYSVNKDRTETVLTKMSMGSSVRDAVSDLKPNEYSDIIKGNDKYYIIKLISRKEAPDEGLEKIKASIAQSLRKRKEKEREEEYLEILRKRATIKMNKEYLSEIKLDAGAEERGKWSGDERVLADVNGVVLTVGGYVAMLSPNATKATEEDVKKWIDLKLVDQEALSRHYNMSADVKNDLYRYKNYLLKNTFIKTVILPRIEITEEAMEEYYMSHREDFLKPVRYRIQQITLKTLEDAQETLNNLKNGADFSWLLKKRSTNSDEPESVYGEWLIKTQLPGPAREIVDALNPGDISPILKNDDHYLIILLQEKSAKEFEKFNEIKPVVYRTLFGEQFQETFNEFVAKLKDGARITINDDAIRLYEERLKK
jgi:peptidyl-prolyl cis-trans isomerase C